jgi:hypothetical protein
LGKNIPFVINENFCTLPSGVENVVVRFEASPTSARDDRQSRESSLSAVIPGCNQPRSARAKCISIASGEMIYRSGTRQQSMK